MIKTAAAVALLILSGCSSATTCGDNGSNGTRVCCGAAGEIPGQNCVPPQPEGGVYGRCLKEGEELEAKVIGGVCCKGLSAIDVEIETDAGYQGYPMGCGPGDAPPSVKVCARCGDGVCGAAENRCNCPSDCK